MAEAVTDFLHVSCSAGESVNFSEMTFTSFHLEEETTCSWQIVMQILSFHHWKGNYYLSKLSTFGSALGRLLIKSLMSLMSAESLMRLASVSTSWAPESSLRFPRTNSDNLERKCFLKAIKAPFCTKNTEIM